MNSNMKHISPASADPIFDRIGKEWMLISATDGEHTNTMTASWGCCGILWNKPIAVCFIRPQRFTCPIVEASDTLSLAFLSEDYRAALTLCGRTSGRDGDKFAAAGLTVAKEDGIPYPAEAHTVLLCKKLYVDTLKKENFLLPELLSHYPIDDFHRVFICEITDVLVKSEAES